MKYQTGVISIGNTGLNYFLYVIFILSLEWKPCIFYWIFSFYSTLFILFIEIDILREEKREIFYIYLFIIFIFYIFFLFFI
ncbi:hypothetical protein PPACK8108_LOCUS20794, partial [Phakopsora pachyrhizi]